MSIDQDKKFFVYKRRNCAILCNCINFATRKISRILKENLSCDILLTKESGYNGDNRITERIHCKIQSRKKR